MTLLLSSLIAGGQTLSPTPLPPPLPLMPLPAQVKPGAGEFLINNGFGIALEGYQEPRLERAKQRFLNILSRETGIPLWREAHFYFTHRLIHWKHILSTVWNWDMKATRRMQSDNSARPYASCPICPKPG